MTITFDDKYNLLLNASRSATNEGIKMAGPDAYLGDIGETIQEIIESYELELNNKTYPLKSTLDLCGHQIDPYIIHAGKVVPNMKHDYNEIMKNNEHYDI